MKLTWREDDDNYVALDMALDTVGGYPMRHFLWQVKKQLYSPGEYRRLLGVQNPGAGAIFLCRVDGDISEEERKGIERVARIRYAEFFEQE